MPKISDAKRAQRREQILNAAWNCFLRQGHHATTMDDVIRASGLSAGAVYSYFPGKQALIEAAVGESRAGLRNVLEPILRRDPPSPPDVLLRDMTAAIDGFTARDGFDLKRLALLAWGEAQRNETLRLDMHQYYTAFRGRLAEVAESWRARGLIAPEADAQEVAKTMLSAVLGYVVQAALLRDVAPGEIGRGAAQLLTRGEG